MPTRDIRRGLGTGKSLSFAKHYRQEASPYVVWIVSD